MSNEGALATLDDDAALQRLAAGTLMKHIAAEFGVTKPAIYKRLSKHPEYKQAIDLQAESLVERAMDEVMTCDAQTVNIARARCDAAFKWAAARDPAKWGNRAQLEVTVNHVLADKLRQAERVIEHDAAQQIEPINDETGQE